MVGIEDAQRPQVLDRSVYCPPKRGCVGLDRRHGSEPLGVPPGGRRRRGLVTAAESGGQGHVAQPHRGLDAQLPLLAGSKLEAPGHDTRVDHRIVVRHRDGGLRTSGVADGQPVGAGLVPRRLRAGPDAVLLDLEQARKV
jgi:hypothetical protein